MIKIKSGVCGTSLGLISASDKAVYLPEAEEKRLVKMGVAVYCNNIAAEFTGTAPENESFEASGGNSVAKAKTASEVNFEAMSVKELTGYAKENGIDISGLKKKADIIEAITDGEAFPKFNVGEDAVV